MDSIVQSESLLSGATFAVDDLFETLKTHVSAASPHEAILSERKLAARHGVSVGTVRAALDRLVREGQVYKVHGKGNFVAEHGSPAKKVNRILYADAWGDMTHPFLIRNLGGIAAEANRHGYRLEILPCPSKLFRTEEFAAICDKATEPDVRALIVPALDEEGCARLHERNQNLRIVSSTKDLMLPGTASVSPNWEAAAGMAVRYLRGRGARRLLFVHWKRRAEYAVREIIPENHREASVETLLANLSDDPREASARILAGGYDGIGFFDDRLAQGVLSEMVRQQPGILASLPTLSVSNVGERILPRETARLEVDGQEIGMTLIAVIHAMDEGRFFGSSVRILPKLVCPEYVEIT